MELTPRHGLLIISIFSFLLWTGFLFLTKNIKPLFPPPGTDSEITVKTAARSSGWRWPSDMHSNTASSTYMKDVTVLMLVLFQKVFCDKKSLFPLTALYSFSAVVSAILIYLTAESYWNPATALVLSLLFIISFWPWQISLFVGHINIATIFFLGAVFLLSKLSANPNYLILVLAGISTGLLLFSSSSSFKYLPPIGAAFVFAKYGLQPMLFFEQGSVMLPVVFSLIFLLPLAIVNLSYKKIISLAYRRQGPIYLRRFIPLKGAEKVGLEHYFKKAADKLNVIQKIVIVLWILLSLLGYLVGPAYLVPFLAGTVFVFLMLTLPNIGKSLGFYLSYLWYHVNPGTGLVSGFVYFKNLFASKGIKITETRTGFRWVIKFFFRMAPFHVILWFALAIFVFIYSFKEPAQLAKLLAVLLTSLSPIFGAELTRSPQIGRTYFPGFPGLFLLIGYIVFIISPQATFWPITILVLSIIFAFNLWRFLGDIYPARMTLSEIKKTLERLDIKEFFTPKTGYQYLLAEAAEPSWLNRCNVIYIESLKEIRHPGWLLIPGMSSKTAMPEIEEVKRGQDLTNDPLLNKLIETGEIERIATAKFKTFGTSNIWVQEGEIPSYRDLILREVTEQDRFKGYAWLVHTDKLKVESVKLKIKVGS